MDNYNKGYYTQESKPNRGLGPNDQRPNKGNNNVLFGSIIILAGVFMLVKTTGIFDNYFLNKIFSFPTLMMIGALIWGAKEKFRFGAWLFLLAAGAYFLLLKFDHRLGQFFYPIAIIGTGIFILLRNKRKEHFIHNNFQVDTEINKPLDSEAMSPSGFSRDEYINCQSIFSSSKHIVTSNNFKGGRAGTIFGSVKLDCRAANIQQDIVIDLYSVFGGQELIFPANWQIVNETFSIFGSVEDKRRLVNNTGYERRVILTGFTLFGGVEIKNL